MVDSLLTSQGIRNVMDIIPKKARRNSLVINFEKKKSIFLEKMGFLEKSRFRRRSTIHSFREKSASHPNCYQLVNSSSPTELSLLDQSAKVHNLTLLLHDENSRKIFKTFLMKEHSSENLDFWLAVDRYRLQDLNRAKMIYARYLHPGGTDEVNVDEKIRKSITEKIKNGHAPVDVFDEAKYAIFLLIKRDSYKRFKRYYDFTQGFPSS